MTPTSRRTKNHPSRITRHVSRVTDHISQLGPNLFLHHDAINTGILRDGNRALLIDCGDAAEALRALGIDRVERVLFTHHHRDQAAGIGPFVTQGARIGVPVAEHAWFTDVERYWNDPAHRWHLYDFHPHSLLLAQSIPVHDTYCHGDVLHWGSATITVLETPGHTDGSVSYCIDLPGGERFVFSGDVIYDEGQLWELYSMQKGWETRDYHGFLGDRKRLVASLDALDATNAAALIPSHGRVMPDPSRAIAALRARLTACYEQYVAISALRYYFPEMFAEYTAREDFLPVGRDLPYPDFLNHIGTIWAIVSEDGAVFLMDCGSEDAVREIQERQIQGRFGRVEGLWITHYHDDHVDTIRLLQETLDESFPIIADKHVAMIVEDPLAWRLPCISPVRLCVDRRTRHGETWQWREFTLTAYHFPGQTLYHGGLLVEGRGLRLFFAGDSFTPAGIDDYCAGNRNFLGAGVGFDACMRLLQALKPDLVFNAHVDAGFTFDDAGYALMRANLAEREKRYGALFPWDHPNYGMDEAWVRCFPYEQRVALGETVHFDVVVTNHSDEIREAIVRPILPEGGMALAPQGTAIASKAEGSIVFRFNLPADAAPGRWIIPVDVTYGGRRLGPFREAVIEVSNGLP